MSWWRLPFLKSTNYFQFVYAMTIRQLNFLEYLPAWPKHYRPYILLPMAIMYHMHSCWKAKLSLVHQTEQPQVYYKQILCCNGMQVEYIHVGVLVSQSLCRVATSACLVALPLVSHWFNMAIRRSSSSGWFRLITSRSA